MFIDILVEFVITPKSTPKSQNVPLAHDWSFKTEHRWMSDEGRLSEVFYI